jgi:hypothetical protein
MRFFEISEADNVVDFDYDKIKSLPPKERLVLFKSNPTLKDLYNKEWQKKIDAELNNYGWMTAEEKAEYEKLASTDSNDLNNKAFSAEKYLKQLFQKKVDRKKASSMIKVHWVTNSAKLEQLLQGKLSNKVELSAYLAPSAEAVGKVRWGDIGVIIDGHITMGGRGDLGSDQYKMKDNQRGQQKYVSRPGQVDPSLSMDTSQHHEVLVDNWKIKEVVLGAKVPQEIEDMVNRYKIPVRRLAT